MPQLPARANLEHLRHEAKQRLRQLRHQDLRATLSEAQLLTAREYGFASWRQLKAAVDDQVRARVFAAARDGDLDSVRQALDAGFHPGTTDTSGRTLHQLAKVLGRTTIERLMREYQERDERPDTVKRIVTAAQAAAGEGRADDLHRLLEEHPEVIDARSVDAEGRTALHQAARHRRAQCVRLLLESGADVSIRDYADNASALHLAAAAGDLAIVTMLVEAGADVIGDGDDHHLTVLGWATCLGPRHDDVAAYLLRHGARLNIWSAIALNRAEDVRHLVQGDGSLLTARLSRNEHYRTPLHHAAALNRPGMVQLLLELGADVNAVDETGATPLSVAAGAQADARVIALLEQAGASVDLLTALSLGRHALAERLLREDPTRIGPAGRDTMALHVAVVRRNADAVRWLIAHGVDVNAKRVVWDCNQTALHITAEHGTVDLARILLDAGADPDIRDDKYQATVLGWAEYCGQPQIATLLRERSGTA